MNICIFFKIKIFIIQYNFYFIKVCHSWPTSLEPTSLMVFGEQAKDQESRKLTKNYKLFIHHESETLRITTIA